MATPKKFWVLAALWLVIAGIALNQAEVRRDPETEYDERFHVHKARYESEPERKSFFEGLRDRAADYGRATFRHLRGPRPNESGMRPDAVDVRGGRRIREWNVPDMNAGGHEHDLKESVKETARDVKRAVKDTAAGLKDTAEDTGYVLKEDLGDVKDTAKEHGRVLREDLRDIKDAASYKAGRFATGVRDRASDAAESVKEGLHEVRQSARDTGHRLKEAAADVKDAAKERVEGWAGSVTDAARATGYKVHEAASDVKEAAKEVVDRWSGRAADLKDATVEKARELKDDVADTVHEAEYKAESKYQRMKDCICAGKNLVVDKVTGLKRCLCDAFGRMTGSSRKEEEEYEPAVEATVFEPAAEGVAEHNLKEDIGHIKETLPLNEELKVVTLKNFNSPDVETERDFVADESRQTEDMPSMWKPRKQFHAESILQPSKEEEARHPTGFETEATMRRETLLEPSEEDYRAMHPTEHSRQHIGLSRIIRDFKAKAQEKYRQYKDKLTSRFRSGKKEQLANTEEKLYEPVEPATYLRPGEPGRVPQPEGTAYSYYDVTKLEHHPRAFEVFAVTYKRGADLYEEARKKIGEIEEPHTTPEMKDELVRQAVVLFKDALAAVEEAEDVMIKRLAHLNRMTKQEYEATRGIGELAYEGAITRAEEELNHARRLIATLFEQLDRDFPSEKY